MVRSRPVEVTVPGDKSITHRALILGALADGESRLTGPLDAADTRSTAAALRTLGAELPAGPIRDLTIRGRGLRGLTPPDDVIDCGNSGTTARLLLGTLAGCPMEATLTGDASLRRRPMARITAPLARAGASFDAAERPDRLPIRVRGARPLADIEHVNERSSAQVTTALLLAALTSGGRATITEPRRSRDHTARMLRAMGAPVSTAAPADGFVVTIGATTALDPLAIRVPGDFSSAAYFLALGVLRGRVRVRRVGLNPTRTGMLNVLRRMGATIDVEETASEGGEPVGDVVVRPSELNGAIVDADEVPALLDEVPVLAAVAATIDDETRFHGVAELRVKESDRIQALVDNLDALGVETDAGPDTLAVRGTGRPLHGTVDAHGDHRIAMAFGVLGALPGNDVRVRGRETVGISYPTFWDELERVNTELEAQ